MSRGRRRSAPAALLTLMSATAFTCAGAASDTGPMVDASALLPLPASHECPTDRYLTLGPRTYTGGFNNMLMTFQAALLLARYTNRTFVVPAARNDRYKEFRFSWAVDYEALKPVWPCFFDSDTPWGEGPAPEAKGEEVTRTVLTTSPGSRGRRVPTSQVASDFHPKRGSLAALPPHRASLQNGVGKKIKDVAREFNEDPDVHNKPVIMVGGSAWGGLMTTCMNPNENGLFYAHVEPSPVIAAEIAHFQKLKGLVDGEYIGVHLRYLEGKCPGRAKMFYMPAVEKQIAAMCHNVYSHTAKVVAGAGLSMAGRQLYLASDRQRPMADKTFEQQGSISYDRGNKKDKYFGDGTHFVTGHLGGKVFEPAFDMFALVGAKLFVGNMLSTFSTNVANIRFGHGGRRSVLAWPEPEVMKERTFWECERATFWCGTVTKEWSSVRHSKAHGNC
mmetsp:Transcript_8743/g.13874  ORF Transcript_8743/g.13874 Transcript_8743/m.13874 type:complete len:446 (+) Transcript_8743:63-1400(+)